MKTVNISLTQDQFEGVEALTKRMGYANRSEFFRSLLRYALRKPEVFESEEIVLEAPPTRSRSKIMSEFRATEKYSEAFLKDLDEGLKDSSYFK